MFARNGADGAGAVGAVAGAVAAAAAAAAAAEAEAAGGPGPPPRTATGAGAAAAAAAAAGGAAAGGAGSAVLHYRWDVMYELLRAFHAEHHHLRVPPTLDTEVSAGCLCVLRATRMRARRACTGARWAPLVSLGCHVLT